MKKLSKSILAFCMVTVVTVGSLPMETMADGVGNYSVAYAAGEVAIDETNFPDEVFCHYVLDNVSHSTALSFIKRTEAIAF